MKTKQSYILWEVNENDFPENKSQEEQLRFLVQYAILAPNSHNTQPWRFKVNNASIKIYPDFSRNLPYSDRANRQLYITLGCALANLLVALEHFGFDSHVTYLPETDLENTAIEVDVKKGNKTPLYKTLFPQIQKRVTNRNPYSKKPINNEILESALAHNDEENVLIRLITAEKEREVINSIAEEASRFVYSDTVFKEELGQWVRSVYTRAFDGMPLFDLPVPGVLTTFAPFVMRGMPALLESKRDRYLFESSPAFLLIHSPKNDKETWIKVGKVFEFISLALTEYGISHTPWAGVIEHEDSNKKLKKLLNLTDNLIFFVRLGYTAQIPHHSPRRKLQDVLL